MAVDRDSMMEPSIEKLLEKVDSKFTLVSLASTRGRQINAYFNQLGEGLGTIVPPQVNSVSRKPLSIAFEEIAADKITYTRRVSAENPADDDGQEVGEAEVEVLEVADETAAEELPADDAS